MQLRDCIEVSLIRSTRLYSNFSPIKGAQKNTSARLFFLRIVLGLDVLEAQVLHLFLGPLVLLNVDLGVRLGSGETLYVAGGERVLKDQSELPLAGDRLANASEKLILCAL